MKDRCPMDAALVWEPSLLADSVGATEPVGLEDEHTDGNSGGIGPVFGLIGTNFSGVTAEGGSMSSAKTAFLIGAVFGSGMVELPELLVGDTLVDESGGGKRDAAAAG